MDYVCIILYGVEPTTGLTIYLKTRKRKVITVLQREEKRAERFLAGNKEGQQVTFEFTVLYV